MTDLGEVPVPSACSHANTTFLRGDVDGVIQRKHTIQIHTATAMTDHGILDVRVPVVPLNGGLRNLGAGSKSPDDPLQKFGVTPRSGPQLAHCPINIVVGKNHIRRSRKAGGEFDVSPGRHDDIGKPVAGDRAGELLTAMTDLGVALAHAP